VSSTSFPSYFFSRILPALDSRASKAPSLWGTRRCTRILQAANIVVSSAKKAGIPSPVRAERTTP